MCDEEDEGGLQLWGLEWNNGRIMGESFGNNGGFIRVLMGESFGNNGGIIREQWGNYSGTMEESFRNNGKIMKMHWG